MKKDKNTVEMFPALDETRVRGLTDKEKYDKLMSQKNQTDLFKGNNEKTEN